MSYTIEKNFIPELPREAYDHGVGMYLGVIAHSTANYANGNDNADGERSYESRTWQSAFVDFFVDDKKILQVADYNYLCYGAGHTANHSGYVQVELCQFPDTARFLASYSRYVWLLAYILYQRHLGVVDGDTLMSHEEVSAKWHESNHSDPIEYLASHGKTWANLVTDVTAEYKKMEGEEDVLKVAVLLFTKDDFWAGFDVAIKNGNCAIFVRGANNSVPAEAMSAKKLIVVGGPTTKHPNELLLSGNDKYETAASVAKYLSK